MFTSLHNMDEMHFWENRPFSGSIPEPKRCKPTDIRKTIKKKAKRIRTAYTTEQLRTLEHIFTQNKYITPDRRREISKSLNIGDKSVKIWFQNRRMKEKRESSESSSDSSTEIFADEGSPALTVSELDHSDQNNLANGNHSPELSQYQVPYYCESSSHVIDQQIPNVHASDYITLQDNGMQYYNENNVYPTQYYPVNGGNQNNEYECNYYQWQQQNSIYSYNNYWNSNNEASSYFYN